MSSTPYSQKLLKTLSLTFVMASLLLVSCVEQGTKSARSKTAASLSGTSGSSKGAGAIPTATSTTDSTVQSVKIELSHLVDPFTGTYKKKLTIPKNYKGFLYLAGLNVTALQNKLVKVRFNFGLDRQSITLDATVGRAPGIIPQTDIQVLMIDMNSRPLSKLRLVYDLYDYNDYTDATKEPVVDPKDGGLYCRGLQLEDDPTFDSSTSTNATCSASTDKCLYAYAKVTDATLYDAATGFTTIPTRPQVWAEANSVRSPSIATSAASMCLPNYEAISGFNALFNTAFSGLLYNDSALGMKYRGPYRAINTTAWRIQGNAIFNNTKGLFEVANSTLDPYTGFRSLLFPRAGKISLNQDVKYMGSTSRFGVRSAQTMIDPLGTSVYVDGCNLRVQNYDVATTESIGSCNVNASIEVFYMKDGSEVNITTDKTIKLQLLRPSTTNSEGREVLASAFKACDTSTTCGTSECCFNKRCWSKELVTQCVDQTPVIGNQEIGANCSSDYECSSLCCNQSTGSCAPHNPNGTVPISCSKSAGQQCVSREFCKPEYVATCTIVKTTVLNGVQQCALRCPAVETYGDCKAGVCYPPAVPAVPTFDPADCSKAVDP